MNPFEGRALPRNSLLRAHSYWAREIASASPGLMLHLISVTPFNLPADVAF